MTSSCICMFNPFKLNGIFHSYQLDKSIYWEVFFSIFIRISIDYSKSRRGYPDPTPCSAASDLGLHCLPMSIKQEAWRKWVIKRLYAYAI